MHVIVKKETPIQMFSVNFGNFLRTAFLTGHFDQLLLHLRLIVSSNSNGKFCKNHKYQKKKCNSYKQSVYLSKL